MVEIELTKVLMAHPELLVFLTIGLGYSLGKLGYRGVRLGSSIGVLVTALVFGHYGFRIAPLVGTIGFIFFIYSVGYQAGPRFFASFRSDGARYIQLSLVIAVAAVATAVIADRVAGLEPGFAAGALAGGLTSTPTLAAAQEAVASGVAKVPEGSTVAQVQSNIAVGYAVTYLFGLIGLLLSLQILPRLLKVDLVAESAALEKGMDGGRDADDELRLGDKGAPSSRIYELTRPKTIGKSLRQLRFVEETGAVVSLIRRGADIAPVDPDRELAAGDRLLVLGYRSSQIEAARLLGEEVVDRELERVPFETRSVVISKDGAVGASLGSLGIMRRYACMLHRLSRGGVEIPFSPETALQRGDLLVISGSRQTFDQLIATLGHAETPVHETDLLVFAFGIVAGLMIGYTSLKVGRLALGVGTASGLLLAGLLVSHWRVSDPMFGRVPRPARFILMELGLLLFLAEIGLRAGGGLVEGLMSSGLSLFVIGALVTLLPLFAGLGYGRYVLKLNPAILFGAMTGGLTSTPALGIITEQAKSNAPAIGYAGTYAFASIILTLAGQIIMLL